MPSRRADPPPDSSDQPLIHRYPRVGDLASLAHPSGSQSNSDLARAIEASLERAIIVVERTRREPTTFATLALGILDKAVRELDSSVQLIEQAAHTSVETGQASRRVDYGHEPTAQSRHVAPHENISDRMDHPAPRSQHIAVADGDPGPRRARDSSRRYPPPDDDSIFRHIHGRGYSRSRGENFSARTEDDPGLPVEQARIKRPSSTRSRRDAYEDLSTSRPGTTAYDSDDTPSLTEPDYKMRSSSRATSRIFSPPLPSAPLANGDASLSKQDEPVVTINQQVELEIRGPPPSTRSSVRGDGLMRPKSRSSAVGGRPVPSPTAPEGRDPASRRPSSRSRHEASSSDEQDDHRARNLPRKYVHKGRARSTSRASNATPSYSGRSYDVRRVLELATAPLPREESALPSSRDPPMLRGPGIARSLVRAIAQNEGTDKKTLAALSLVSKEYREATLMTMYRAVTITSTQQLRALTRTLESTPSLGAFVDTLVVRPLDAQLPAPTPESLIAPLKTLLDLLPNLTALDEDFTAGDWDVGDLSQGRDYPLAVSASSSSSKKLVRFRSARCWWEIGALFALLESQPHLVELIIGGAAMDRDWVGAKLLTELSSYSAPPACRLESLEVAQIMHEDTLAVLLRSTTPASFASAAQGRLKSVRVGFQSLGDTDDDTPRASIPSALALVASTVTHLAFVAPQRTSEDTKGLLDTVVAALPSLQVLEWSEATDRAPLPLASTKLLTRLPPSVHTLRARSLVSLSTSDVLAFLADLANGAVDGPPSALRCLDLQWAKSEPQDNQEPWFKARHLPRIEAASAELGIQSRVSKGDDALVLCQL